MLEHLQLEAVFAWLSTLGGAHSALGDYFNKNVIIHILHNCNHYAIRRGVASQSQLGGCRVKMTK